MTCFSIGLSISTVKKFSVVQVAKD